MGNSLHKLLTDPSPSDLEAMFAFAERGFNERADVAVQAADGTDLNDFYREVQRTLQIRNGQRDRMIDLLTYRVDREVETVVTPAAEDFEEASEYGQPKGIRGGARQYMGYDFKFYDLAVRFTWMFIAEANRAQLENLNNMALEADNRLLFNRVMRTLFNSINSSGYIDGNIPVTVYKFYNGDGMVPPSFKTYTHAGSHNHYLTTQGLATSATLTSPSLDAAAMHLEHHGYGVNNGTRLVLMVNKQESAIISTFRVATGSKFDFIPSSNYGGGVYLPANGGIVARPEGQVANEFGTYGPWHIVEEDYVPAGYLVGLASGGPDNLVNPIGIREHVNPAYRGLKVIPGQRSDYPLLDSFYRRGFGTGVRQRGGGVIVQVSASGTYAIPAAYV